jgi:thioredoxin reductase
MLADLAGAGILESMDEIWDCVIVGGGAAGQMAAIVLGRARRRTLLVDAGQQSNRPAAGIGGLLGHDGRPPSELYALGRDEIAQYPAVTVVDGTVVDAARTGDAFTVRLEDGTEHTTRRILLATGMDYVHRDLPGADALWGNAVFHCPFCHGWEHRDEALAVLDSEATGVHRAQLLRMWSDDVTLLTDGPSALDAEQTAQLAALGVRIDERPVTSVRGAGHALEAITFADGAELAATGLLIAVTLRQRTDLATKLGVETAEPNPLAGDAVAVDAFQATNVPGVFAAGDTTAKMPSVAAAIAAGHAAAAMVVQSLLG